LNWKTFFTRTGTAIVFAIVMMTGLLGQASWFLILLLLIQFLCIREYFSLLKKINPEAVYSTGIQVLVQLFGAGCLFLCSGLPGGPKSFVPGLLFMPVLLLLIQSLQKGASVSQAFQSLGALLYICLPVSLLMLLREQSLVLPLGLILLIWINDTMAYIVGSFIGKTPFSSISPKKTWEGTVGGALLTVAAAVVYGLFTEYYSISDWIALSLCASVAGTVGDLFESKLKRVAGVKDSGSFMPGHGGALDRFDSLLVAAPFAYCYAYLFMPTLNIHIF
jgi:phosphatidate cytidylyltransferase